MNRSTTSFSACVSAFVTVVCALLLALAPGASWAEGETALTSSGGELGSGSYILNEDVELTSDITIPSGAEVTIDLNGHTLTGTGSGSVITVSGSLTIQDGTVGESPYAEVAASDLPSSVYTAATDSSEASFTADTVADTDSDGNATGTWTTYWSVTDYDDSGELAITYYSYTSGAITGGESEAGGGVHVASGGSLTLESGTITGNTAVYTDDGTDTGTGSDTEGTEAPAYEGGGVYGEAGASITMTGGAISGNTADEGAGVDIQGSSSSDVATVAEDDASSSETASDAAFSMSGGVISGNTAADDGGGVRVDLCSFLMTGGTIANNTAEGNYGGGVAVIAQGSMTLDGGTISNNTAYGTGSSAHYGGGIDLDRSSLTMESGLITGNYASSAGGGVRLYNLSTFTMKGGTIAGNTATNYGGGVALNSSGTDAMSSFTMLDGLIADNEATDTTVGCGGGVYVETGSFSMSGGTIRGNAARSTFYDTYLYYGGGGVWMYNSTFTMGGNALITGNYAPCGGGAFLYMCTTTLSDSASIMGNEALYGGGVYAYYNYNSAYALSGGSITDNEATYGGGIYAYYSNVISGCTVTDNAATYGGGVYASYGATLDGCTVSGNTATQGGGIYDANTSDYTLAMTGCTVAGNTAAASSDDAESSDASTDSATTASYVGGGLYVAGGTLETMASSSTASLLSVLSSSSTSVVANNAAATSADDVYISSSASVDLSGVNNLSTAYLADELGATIDGWYGDPATARYYKDGDYNIDAVENVSSGTEYFLVAAHGLYTVTYYDGYSMGDDGELLNDGLGDILAQTTDNIYGAAVPTTDDPTREGFEFLGWELVEGTASTESTSVLSALWSLFSTSSYYSASDISEMTITGDMAFEAQWEETYTVTYDANETSVGKTDGSATGSTSDDNEYMAGATVTAAANGFTLTGYTFTGWNTKADGTGSAYEAGSTFTMGAANVTLYAQWEKTYTVTYTDGVDDEEVFADQVTTGLTSGTTTPAFSGTPTRTGYEFTGWSPEVADTVTGDAVYVAQWKEITYTVTYTDGVDDEEVFADQVTTGLTSGTTTPAFSGTPTRTGYEFTGWSPEVADTVTGDAVYVAQWKEITYTVTYTDGVDDEKVFVDQVHSGIPEGDDTPAFEAADGTSTPTRAGYTFTGWSPEVADTVTADVTYTAQWTKNADDDDGGTKEGTPTYHTVTYTDGVDDEEVFVDQVHSGIPEGDDTPAFEAADGTSTPTRAGYTFTGWSPEVADTVTADVTYTAQWEAATYTVTYHANADDATGSVDSQTASYGEFVTVSDNGFTRTGYTFTGWNTASDGTGTSYAPGDDLAVTSNIDLYAQWEPEGGDVEEGSKSEEPDDGGTVEDEEPEDEEPEDEEPDDGGTVEDEEPEDEEPDDGGTVEDEEPEDEEPDDGGTVEDEEPEDEEPEDGGTVEDEEPEDEEPDDISDETESKDITGTTDGSESESAAASASEDEDSLSGTGDDKLFTAASIACMGIIALVSGLAARRRPEGDGR